MDPRKEKFRGFKELKKIAAERIMRMLSNRLFIDIRKVRRFRIWQSEYLDHVMYGISQKNSEKHTNLKLKYLQFLSSTLQKYIRKALYLWTLSTKSFKQSALPNAKLASSLKIASILLLKKSSTQGYKEFSYTKFNSWKNSRVKVALSIWKRSVITSLLSESHQEMAAVRLVHFLHKKTTPLINFAINKICFRAGIKLPAFVLGITLKKLMCQQKHFAFMNICRKKTGFVTNFRGAREQKQKFVTLQKFVAIKQLSLIARKKKMVNVRFLELLKVMIKWKSLRKKGIKKHSKRAKGTNRRIKLMGAKFLMFKWKEVLMKRVLAGFVKWKVRPKVVFEIDKNVICTQAQVAVYLEAQIIKKETEIKKLRASKILTNLNFGFLKRLKKVFEGWAEVCVNEVSQTNDRDIVYEYIRYLEDNLGVPHRFRH